jgi:hypothetical protein
MDAQRLVNDLQRGCIVALEVRSDVELVPVYRAEDHACRRRGAGEQRIRICVMTGAIDGGPPAEAPSTLRGSVVANSLEGCEHLALSFHLSEGLACAGKHIRDDADRQCDCRPGCLLRSAVG